MRADLLPALKRALDSSDDELAAMRARLAGVKQRYLEDSLRELAQAIALVGSPRPVDAMVADGSPEMS